MEPREIPGYYWSEEKRRYFKIESGTTAPASARHNAHNVKKRKLEDAARKDARKRHERLATHIKPARVLSDPLTGARLMREIGVCDPELPAKSWITALQSKGGVVLGSADGPSVDCMLVNGHDSQSGMGVVYAATHGARYVRASYIPTDTDGTINFDADPLKRTSRSRQIYTEPFIFDDITSISYHKSSHRILQTSKAAGADQARITIFEPVLSERFTRAHAFTNEAGPHPAWLLGETQSNVSFTLDTSFLSLRRSCAAPPAHGSSSLTALVATNRGLIKVFGSQMVWLGLQYSTTPEYAERNAMPYDALSVDWHPTSPNTCFAGNRNGSFYRIDLRLPYWSWDRYRHRSSAAHIRAVNEYQILVAGPMSAMAVYDVRYMETARRGEEAAPLCTMPEYVNSAHVNIGLDITTIAGEGIVAAANDTGTIDAFSMRTGKKMNAGSLGQVAVTDGVVKCLQWEKMPWENEPSLWAGVGNMVQKISFGLDEREDEDC